MLSEELTTYFISMIIRGEDHISNTPKQIHIRQSLGYKKDIKYVHLPVILNAKTSKKMSKRDDASSVKWLIEQGFLPSAIANYLVCSAKFDIDKLRFINRKHIQMLDDMRLSKILGFADTDIGKLAKLYLEETSTTLEIKYKIDSIFAQKLPLKEYEEQFEKIKDCLQKAPFFEDYEDLKSYVIEKTNLKGKNLFKPLRFILTETQNGPNISDIYPFIKNYLGEIVR